MTRDKNRNTFSPYSESRRWIELHDNIVPISTEESSGFLNQNREEEMVPWDDMIVGYDIDRLSWSWAC